MINRFKQGFVGAFFLMLAAGSAHAGDIPLIDAHSQVDLNVDLSDVIALIKKAGVSRTILATRGKLKWQRLVAFAEHHADRITPSVRVKGEIYRNNDPRYYKRLRKQLQEPAFGAISELLIFHAQKGDVADEVYVALDSPQVRATAAAAVENGWPIVIHIEFASTDLGEGDVPGRDKLMADFEMFLKRYRNHPVALIHMGQLEVKDVRRLIEAHGNIHFLTSHCNPVTVPRSRQPWVDLFHRDGTRLADDWRALVIEHPSRFILAFDNVLEEHWGDYYLDQVEVWRKALAELPPAVAHMIAHRNAERLWKLPPAKTP